MPRCDSTLDASPRIHHGDTRVSTGLATLTRREREVLDLVTQGCSTRQIGVTLCLAKTTVYNHLQHIYRKLQVHSRLEAVRTCLVIGAAGRVSGDRALARERTSEPGPLVERDEEWMCIRQAQRGETDVSSEDTRKWARFIIRNDEDSSFPYGGWVVSWSNNAAPEEERPMSENGRTAQRVKTKEHNGGTAEATPSTLPPVRPGAVVLPKQAILEAVASRFPGMTFTDLEMLADGNRFRFTLGGEGSES